MIHHGMNLRDFERAFRELGGEITDRRRHGERFYSHPALPGRRAMQNIRRKDTTRQVTALALDVLRMQA